MICRERKEYLEQFASRIESGLPVSDTVRLVATDGIETFVPLIRKGEQAAEPGGQTP